MSRVKEMKITCGFRVMLMKTNNRYLKMTKNQCKIMDRLDKSEIKIDGLKLDLYKFLVFHVYKEICKTTIN